MRLILTHKHFDTSGLGHEWKGGGVYHLNDDLSVGPVDAWPDREAFRRQRAGFTVDCLYDSLCADWSVEDFLDMWVAVFPRVTMEQMIAMSPEDQEAMPEPEKLDDALRRADIVELWGDKTLQGQVFKLFALAELDALELVGTPVVTKEFDQRDREGLRAALDQALEGAATTGRVVTETERAVARELWAARIALPKRPDAGLFEKAGAEWTQVFEGLQSRFPDQTGLSGLEQRVLQSAQRDWTKMARLVADVMVAGFDSNDYVGDRVLQHVLEQMALRTDPLIEVRGAGPEMRFREVRLTDAGGAQQA